MIFLAIDELLEDECRRHRADDNADAWPQHQVVAVTRPMSHANQHAMDEERLQQIHLQGRDE